MAIARYFVLDVDAPGTNKGVRGFGPRAFGVGTAPVAKPVVKVAAAELSPKEAAQERKRPGRLLERAFPVRLIAPTAKIVPPGDSTNTAWGITATKADQVNLDGSGVTVAVLDTGIRADHAAFAHYGDRLVVKDFTEQNGKGIDNHGHGTHCAGTIFGGPVNGTRIGIAPNVGRALVGKVLPDGGGGDTAMLFQALQWASQEGARVVSMSLGFDFPGMVKDLIEGGVPEDVAASNALVLFTRNLRGFDRLMSFFQVDKKMMVVAASGNESRRTGADEYLISASLPASADNVIPIGAYGRKGSGFEIAPFSNTDVALCAPGVDVLSADAANLGGLIEMSGTSMACPHIAGLTALWCQKLGAAANAERVREELMQAAVATKLPTGFDEAQYGRGRAMAPGA